MFSKPCASPGCVVGVQEAFSQVLVDFIENGRINNGGMMLLDEYLLMLAFVPDDRFRREVHPNVFVGQQVTLVC